MRIDSIRGTAKKFIDSFSGNILKLFLSDDRKNAKLVEHIARTGEGTDACLEEGALPMLVHFYSPVPDIQDLIKRDVWSGKSDLPGIDFRPEAQLELIHKLGDSYGKECKWPEHETKNKRDFYTHNSSFSFGCAAPLYTMIRYNKPQRIIEIGSGNSSLIIGDAISKNQKETAQPCEYTIIDPYPNNTVRKEINEVSTLLDERVELLDPSFFDILEEGDLLFIDSGHTVRIASDVNYLYLNILPRLNPGVIVHIHDISLPYEYSETYFTNPSFRVFWTEAYLLQAFLAFNSEYEVLLAMNFLQTEHMDHFCAAFPHFNVERNWANSGSFWIRRKKKQNNDESHN